MLIGHEWFTFAIVASFSQGSNQMRITQPARTGQDEAVTTPTANSGGMSLLNFLRFSAEPCTAWTMERSVVWDVIIFPAYSKQSVFKTSCYFVLVNLPPHLGSVPVVLTSSSPTNTSLVNKSNKLYFVNKRESHTWNVNYNKSLSDWCSYTTYYVWVHCI